MNETVRTMDMPDFEYENYKGWAIRYASGTEYGRLWALCDILKAMSTANITLAQCRICHDKKVLAFRCVDGEPCGTGMWLLTDGGFEELLKTSRMPERKDMLKWLSVMTQGCVEDESLPPCDSPDVKLSVMSYGGEHIRMFIKDDELWFVLKDLCNVLGIVNSRNVTARLDADELGEVRIVDVNSNGTRQLRTYTAVKESGMYDAIMQSVKPKAKAFKLWLRKDVLPALRKTQRYEMVDRPTLMLPGMSVSERLDDALMRLDERNALNPTPYMDAEEFASLATDGKLGREAFFRWMRDKGYLVK